MLLENSQPKSSPRLIVPQTVHLQSPIEFACKLWHVAANVDTVSTTGLPHNSQLSSRSGLEVGKCGVESQGKTELPSTFSMDVIEAQTCEAKHSTNSNRTSGEASVQKKTNTIVQLAHLRLVNDEL